MKVNAIGVHYLNHSNNSVAKKKLRAGEASATETNSPQSTGFSKISFKGGNKDDVLHVVAECRPFNQAGGVATVVDDYNRLNNASATSKGKAVFVTPFYNGIVKYDENGIRKGVDLPKVPNEVPDGHPLKGLEGKYIYVKGDLSKQSLLDATKSGNFWVLEEVAEKKMTWGSEQEAPIKLLRIKPDKNGKPGDNFFMIFSEATAYDPKPYSKGQYSSAKKVVENSWLGDPYAKFDKAVVEFMEDISKQVPDFDPATVVCSDSQAAYVSHYMAKKNAEGVEYFKGKKPVQIGHNLGDGYIGMTSARNMMVNLDIYSPEELKELMNTPEYIKALQEGNEAEEKYIMDELKIFDKMAPKNKISAISVAEHYGQKGYLTRLGVVSQGYLDEITTNPEIAAYLHEDMKALKDKGVAVGFTNPLNDGNHAFKDVNLEAYKSEIKVKFADGKEEVLKPLLHFEEKDRATLTLKQLKEYKKQNKINFLERFSPKYDNIVEATNVKTGKKIGNGAADYIRAGAANNKATIIHNLDPKYLEKLKKGEDVNVIVSWGRGDFQKAFDEVLTGFKKYVDKSGDKNAILIMGGDLANDPVEGDKIKTLADMLSKNDAYKGRILLIDGFAPGRPMARMGDVALFPSRTMPCELTDLEAKSELCTPVLPDGQGMKQKNFDPDNPKEATMADAYKTKHQYFSSREEMLKSAQDQDKEAFNKVYTRVKKDIEDTYRIKMKKEISPELLEKELIKDADYNVAIRNLRDNVMTDELADAMIRRFKHTDDKVAEDIMKNQIAMLTGWEDNQKITQSAKPTGELYRETFHLDAKNIDKADVIGSHVDKSRLSAAISDSAKKPGFWKSKGGKWTIAAMATLAAAGGIFAILKGKSNKAATPIVPLDETKNVADQVTLQTEKIAEDVVGENLSAVA